MGQISAPVSKFVCMTLLAASATVSATMARADHIQDGDAFYGAWWLSDSHNGQITLGDGGGYGLELWGTPDYCGRPGSGYGTMQDYIASNYPNDVYWYVDRVCREGYIRLCVDDAWGNTACSTYIENGWVPF